MRHAVMLALLAVVPAAAHAAQPFTAERSWEIQRIGNPEVSPDGRHIVAPVSRTVMADDKLLTDLWLWSSDGSVQRPLTGDPASEATPRFSTDGQTLAFVAQRDDDKVPAAARQQLQQVRAEHPVLDKMVSMREELRQMWLNTNHSREQLAADLQAWCRRAEESGIEALRQFSLKLRAAHA